MAMYSSCSPPTSRPHSQKKPLPLKQRTSSTEQRRDYSTQTWTSVVVGGILKPREFLITVDNFSIWRRHVAWAMASGQDLRAYLTQRYASSMVFLSLLLSTELGVLFNSSTSDLRTALSTEAYNTTLFWCGILIITSAMLTLLSLISTFTAWTMVSAVSAENAHLVFRSSIGQYAAELPGRLIVGAVYTFIGWIGLFVFVLFPPGLWSMLLILLSVSLFVHTISTFSAFGRIILHSGAMSSTPIFSAEQEPLLRTAQSIHRLLLIKAKQNLESNTSIRRQYCSNNRRQSMASSTCTTATALDEAQLQANRENRSTDLLEPPQHRRASSLVKFADGKDTQGNDPPPPPSVAAATSPASRSTMDDGKIQSLAQVSPSPTQQRRPPRPSFSRQSSATPTTQTTGILRPPSPLSDVAVVRNNDFAERWLQQQQQTPISTLGCSQWPPDILVPSAQPRGSWWGNQSDLTFSSSIGDGFDFSEESSSRHPLDRLQQSPRPHPHGESVLEGEKSDLFVGNSPRYHTSPTKRSVNMHSVVPPQECNWPEEEQQRLLGNPPTTITPTSRNSVHQAADDEEWSAVTPQSCSPPTYGSTNINRSEDAGEDII